MLHIGVTLLFRKDTVKTRNKYISQNGKWTKKYISKKYTNEADTLQTETDIGHVKHFFIYKWWPLVILMGNCNFKGVVSA